MAAEHTHRAARWLQLHGVVRKEQVTAIEDFLHDAGALSVTLRDEADVPVLEPGVGETPLWPSVLLTALFDFDDANGSENDPPTEFDRLLQQLNKQFDGRDWKHELLQDQDWEKSWLDQFQPLQMGERLWICPSWSTPPKPEAINLLLDPGLAFGTGTHPTTALCLEWLDATKPNNSFVIDYGCGSGILGIAALLLGARAALFVDNDPQALTATVNNANNNHIGENNISVCTPEDANASLAAMTASKADIVLANILAEPLIELAPTLVGFMPADSKLALAGLLHHQVEAVTAAYRDSIEFEPVRYRDDWALLTGVRRSD